MNQIRAYVHGLFKEIPDNDNKKSVEEEIIQNLEEKVIDLMESGKAEEDAINKAIVDFGDIDDIKKELIEQSFQSNNKAKIQMFFSLWASGLIIALLVFTNLYFSPKVIWFVYPTFAVIWWPLVMFFRWLERR